MQIRKSFQTGIEYDEVDAEEMKDRLEAVSNAVRKEYFWSSPETPCVQHRKGGKYALTDQGRIFFERLTNVLYSVHVLLT